MRVTFEKFVFKKKKDAYRVNLEYFVPKMSAIFTRFFFLFLVQKLNDSPRTDNHKTKKTDLWKKNVKDNARHYITV